MEYPIPAALAKRIAEDPRGGYTQGIMRCASNRILAEHRPPPGHPEHPERILAPWEALEARFGRGIVSVCGRRATGEELCAAHSPGYIERLFSLGGLEASLDYETFLSEGSLEAIRAASGICLELMEQVIRGEDPRAFALVRPPGHHAGYSRGMGYCVVNHLAVAVRGALRRGLRRIAVIDWDAHHGNGTQELFAETDEVLFMDLHQENLFPPQSGNPEEGGINRGEGFTVNVPLPPGSDGTRYLAVMDRILYPRLQAYKPQVICVSSGFDALAGDLEAALGLTPEDFGAMTRRVRAWAEEFCGGRVFMTLEGGYRIESLSAALGECLSALGEGE